MSIVQFINNTINSIPRKLEDEFDFVKNIWIINNPDKKYNEEITKKAFSLGYKTQIIQAYLQMITSNPSKYNLQMIVLTDKDGKILKQECKEL